MVLDMKDNGKMIKRMVKVNFNMLMETSMKESGSTIKRKGMEHIVMLMAHFMKGLG